MADIRRKIVIVGGGITGLSAAFYTKKAFEQRQIPVDITLVEKSDRLGGNIRTLRRDGFVIEQGPDSFLARKLPIIELARELGLEEELTGVNPQAKASFILHRGHLHPMPLGLVLGIPTALAPFAKTGLISPAGKIRAALDMLLPRKTASGDESLGGFIERRLGREVLENITEPLLAGIYAGDTRQLSLQATFPQFRELELKHRSLIMGMMAAKREPRAGGGELPEIARRSMFLTFKQGLSILVDRLAASLPSVRTITGQSAVRLVREEGRFRLALNQGTELEADGVVLACPTFEATKLLSAHPAIRWLTKIEYASVANVAWVYRPSDIGRLPAGSGMVVPHAEGKMITACTWSSSKWLHVAPPGSVLLRTYVGRFGSQEWTELSDKELIAGIRKDLRDTMGIAATPVFYEIARCHRSMPQYPVGHVEQLERLRSQLREDQPGLWLCGAGYEGVGIPDCVRQGKQAAERMLAHAASI